MVKGMPRRSPNEVAGRPVRATSRALLWKTLGHRSGQGLEDDGPRLKHRRPQIRVGLAGPCGQLANVALLRAVDVFQDGVQRAAASARACSQLHALRRLRGAVEGRPARLQDLAKPRELRGID